MKRGRAELQRRRLCPWDRVVLAAARAARSDGTGRPIGSDHLLLGVLAEPATITGRYLGARGVDQQTLAALSATSPSGERGSPGTDVADGRAVEVSLRRGGGRVVELTPEAHRAVAVALAATPYEQMTDLGPDEIALGLVATRDGRARRLLERAGVRPAGLVACLTGAGR
jgi:hypothetical protein